MSVEKVIFQEIEDQNRRASAIRDNCDEIIPDYLYMRKFTEDEIIEYKDELSENSVDLDSLKTEMEEITKDIKNKMKPKKERLKYLLKCLREKAISVKDECYVLKSDTNYCIYNAEGELVFSRPLKPSERQKTINMALREGTNN